MWNRWIVWITTDDTEWGTATLTSMNRWTLLLLLRLVVSPISPLSHETFLMADRPFCLLPALDSTNMQIVRKDWYRWHECLLRHFSDQLYIVWLAWLVSPDRCYAAMHPPRPRQYWKAIEETNKTRVLARLLHVYCDIVISSYWLMLHRSFVGEHTWNCKINENNQLAGPYAGNYLEIIHSI